MQLCTSHSLHKLGLFLMEPISLSCIALHDAWYLIWCSSGLQQAEVGAFCQLLPRVFGQMLHLLQLQCSAPFEDLKSQKLALPQELRRSEVSSDRLCWCTGFRGIGWNEKTQCDLQSLRRLFSAPSLDTFPIWCSASLMNSSCGSWSRNSGSLPFGSHLVFMHAPFAS